MDANNSGEWESCVEVEDMGLPANWAARAYVGLTATTGALADNHDLLALQAYSDQAVMEQDEALEKQTKGTSFVLPDEGTLFERLNV